MCNLQNQTSIHNDFLEKLSNISGTIQFLNLIESWAAESLSRWLYLADMVYTMILKQKIINSELWWMSGVVGKPTTLVFEEALTTKPFV